MITKESYRERTEVRPLPIRYTVDDIEYLPDDENVKYELIGGELFVSRAPHLNHQRIITNLILGFGEYLRHNPIGEIFPGPGVIFTREDAVIPDLVFATHETVNSKVTADDEKFPGKFNAAPEMLIEVLSYGKRDLVRDRIRKREIYGRFGVKEYWIVDGMVNEIEVYRLDGENEELIKRFEINESIESPLLPGFELRLSDIFKF
ncbi:Uma2 family endonuclease [soil metagenome]